MTASARASGTKLVSAGFHGSGRRLVDDSSERALLGRFMQCSRSVSRSFAVLVLAPVVAMLATACERKTTPNGEATDTRTAQVDSGATAPSVGAAPAAGPAVVEKVEIPEVRVRADADTTVRVSWITPKGTTVNDEAPFRVRWNRSDGLIDAPDDVKSTGSAVKDGFKVKIRPTPGAPNATLDGEINIVVCDDVTHSVCVPVRRSVELGFVVVKDAVEDATVAIPLPAAK